MEPVIAVAASCSIEVEAAPRFAEGLQRDAGGSLSKEQLACAAKGYAHLSAKQISAATGAVMDPADAKAAARAPIEAILRSCKIQVKGN